MTAAELRELAKPIREGFRDAMRVAFNPWVLSAIAICAALIVIVQGVLAHAAKSGVTG
jgi:hypothetical protein